MLSLLLFAGCGQKADGEDVSTVSVEKDGSIISTAVEDFGKEYYNEAELTQEVEGSVADYNAAAGEGSVELKELKFVDGLANMNTKFKDGKSYAEYTNVIFFAGTVAEAYEQGYSLDVTLKSTAGEEKDMGKAELLAAGTMNLIITEEPIQIKAYKNIGYTSENVTVTGKKEALVTEGSDELAYILLK